MFLNMKEMVNWAINTEIRLKLNQFQLVPKVTELFWAVGNVRISVGYILLAYETCLYPKGTKGKAHQKHKIPTLTSISEIHYWYHTHNARECIYRCWERITNIIVEVCYADMKDNFYYNTLIDKLSEDGKFNDNPTFRKLKKHVKQWGNVSDIRNKLTHEISTPFKENINIEISDLYDYKNNTVLHMQYSAPILKKEIQEIKDRYLHLASLWQDTMTFIEDIAG